MPPASQGDNGGQAFLAELGQPFLSSQQLYAVSYSLGFPTSSFPRAGALKNKHIARLHRKELSRLKR